MGRKEDIETVKKAADAQNVRRSAFDGSTEEDHAGHGCSFDRTADSKKRSVTTQEMTQIMKEHVGERFPAVDENGKVKGEFIIDQDSGGNVCGILLAAGGRGPASGGGAEGRSATVASGSGGGGRVDWGINAGIDPRDLGARYSAAKKTDEGLELARATKAYNDTIDQGEAEEKVGSPISSKVLKDIGGYNAVEPPHYRRGPKLVLDLGEQITKGKHTFTHIVQCIEVMRHIKDPRLATAFKYIWRVAFGGKREPGETREQREIDRRDIESAVWYLQDWLSNPM